MAEFWWTMTRSSRCRPNARAGTACHFVTFQVPGDGAAIPASHYRAPYFPSVQRGSDIRLRVRTQSSQASFCGL